MNDSSPVVGKPKIQEARSQDPCEVARSHLQRLRAIWIPGAPPELKQKLGTLEETLEVIDKCIQEHNVYAAQEFLPELNKYAGCAVVQGLLLEHLEIRDSMENLKQIMEATATTVADREKSLVSESQIGDSINTVLQLMNEHADRVEIIVNLVQKTRDGQMEQELHLSGVGINDLHPQ